MGEEGLEAIHKITKNITIQEEKIWRQTASKKCLKKEIEKIEGGIKRYESQIANLRKDPLYEKRDEVARLLEDNMKEHIQTHKLLLLSIQAKKAEVERKSEDIKSWEKKYKEVITELEEAYEIKKNFYESTNPTYKKLMETNVAQKSAEVKLKQLKASSERRQRMKKQLFQIKEKIFHTTILNFVRAVFRKEKYEEVCSKTKELEEKKKKMVRDMFEAQEALKKLRVRHTQIPSGMFTRRVPDMKLTVLSNRNEIRRMTDFMPDINRMRRTNISQMNAAELKMIEKKTTEEMSKNKENLPAVPKKNTVLPSSRVNIISNKMVALPPLKSILTRQRSRLDTTNSSFGDLSFSRSQLSQNDKTKIPKSTPKSSQEEKTQPNVAQNVKDTSMEITNNKEQAPITFPNPTKPSEYLKNLKCTISQTNKFQTPKIGTTPLGSQSSQPNQTQKASILKSQVCKRKLNESLQDVDLDISQRKKEKNVNFAIPIQQHIEIDQSSTTSNEMHLNLSSPMSPTTNMNTSTFLDENMAMLNSSIDAKFQIESPPFSFAHSDIHHQWKHNEDGRDMAPVSIFGDTKNAEPSLRFCFEGSSEPSGEVWDLF